MTNAINDKQRVAIYAADLIEDGMVVGLGTGSTANYFIDELARKRREDGLNITSVASSVVSTIKAQQSGLPLVSIEHLSYLDLYVDGADEVTPDMTLLKGRGYDLVKEKLLATTADRFYVLVDDTKLVAHIGEKFPIPIEVMPFAWQLVLSRIEALGAHGQLRANSAGDGLAITSHGSLVLDVSFPETIPSQAINELLNGVPGIVEHGIFSGLATAVMVGENGQVTQW